MPLILAFVYYTNKTKIVIKNEKISQTSLRVHTYRNLFRRNASILNSQTVWTLNKCGPSFSTLYVKAKHAKH